MANKTVKIPVGAAWAPTTSGATYELITGSNLTYPAWHFDATTIETIFFEVQAPSNYVGGDISLRIRWISTGTSDNVVWGASMLPKRNASTWDAAFAALTTTTTAVPGTAGNVAETTISLSSSSVRAGDTLVIKVSRDATNGSDSSAVDATIVDMDWLIDAPGPQYVTARVATEGNISSLSSGAPDVVDGVSVSVGDLILVWQQTTASQNGIYVVDTVGTGSNGVWSRAAIMDTDDEAPSGFMVYVSEGDLFGLTPFVLTTTAPITVSVTSLTFTPGRSIVRDDFNETSIQSSVAFTAHAAPTATSSIEVRGFTDIDVSVQVTDATGINDIRVLAQWSSEASPSSWDTIQSDDAIASGVVALADYQATRTHGKTVTFRVGWNFPTRGRFMRFLVSGNTTGGAYTVLAFRHVRGG